MKALVLSCVAFCSLALSGCTAVDSVHPLYRSDDGVVEPALEGTWISGDNDKTEIRIEMADNFEYNMVVSSPDSKIVEAYKIHLVRLEDQLFMDLVFKSQAVCRTDVEVPLGAVSHHVIAKFEITDDDLAYSAMDADSIEEQNMGEYFPLDYVNAGGAMLVTAPTESLRKYISIHVGRVFSDYEHLTRKAETAQPQAALERSSRFPLNEFAARTGHPNLKSESVLAVFRFGNEFHGLSPLLASQGQWYGGSRVDESTLRGRRDPDVA